MAQYEFVTTWHLDAPPSRVWVAIVDTASWPRWWPSVRRVDLLRMGDETGVGTVNRYEFRGRLPYTLAFEVRTTTVDPPRALDGVASGELRGIGQWRLAPEGDGTVVTYRWAVETTQWWMNILAPLLRPVFVANHDYVMTSGEQGLRHYLATPSASGDSADSASH